MAVGMQFLCQSPVRALHVLCGSVCRQPEDAIVVLDVRMCRHAPPHPQLRCATAAESPRSCHVNVYRTNLRRLTTALACCPQIIAVDTGRQDKSEVRLTGDCLVRSTGYRIVSEVTKLAVFGKTQRNQGHLRHPSDHSTQFGATGAGRQGKRLAGRWSDVSEEIEIFRTPARHPLLALPGEISIISTR